MARSPAHPKPAAAKRTAAKTAIKTFSVLTFADHPEDKIARKIRECARRALINFDPALKPSEIGLTKIKWISKADVIITDINQTYPAATKPPLVDPEPYFDKALGDFCQMLLKKITQ